MSKISTNSKTNTAIYEASSHEIHEKGDKITNCNEMTTSAKRQTLKVLQEKAENGTFKNAETGTNTLIGRYSGGFSYLFGKEKSHIKSTKKLIKIFEDLPKVADSTPPIVSSKSESVNVISAYTQTKLSWNDLLDDKAMNEPDTQFYKDLAEKRREALNESLKENEELWIENEEQKEKVKTLETKVHSLEETVEKARKISEILEPYLDDDLNISKSNDFENTVFTDTTSTVDVELKANDSLEGRKDTISLQK